MNGILDVWPMLVGVVAGVTPAAIAFGSLRARFNAHDEADRLLFADIKKRLDRGDAKMDDLMRAVTEVGTDIKWIKAKQ